MLIAALPDSETAGNIATLMFSLTLVFNGVFQPPDALPGFWIFMYRVSPLTYLVDGIVATGLHGREVVCAGNELAIVQPLAGQTCGQYLEQYAQAAHGAVYNPDATADCQYCPVTVADDFLSGSNIVWDERWRNWGLGFAYIGFNIVVAVLLYYLIRVRKGSGKSMQERMKPLLGMFKRDAKEKAASEKQPAPSAPFASS
jgi:ABC-type multidrug transport system permease subunit